MFEQKNDQDSVEFPFTKTHTEDVMFLKGKGTHDGGWEQYALALECIIYMSDCFYYRLVRNEGWGPKGGRPRVYESHVNRMGTENYRRAERTWNQEKV